MSWVVNALPQSQIGMVPFDPDSNTSLPLSRRTATVELVVVVVLEDQIRWFDLLERMKLPLVEIVISVFVWSGDWGLSVMHFRPVISEI